MKNNNKILYISIAILVLAAGILFGTYAYYQTTISGTISGNVAKWSFKANNQTSTFNLDLGSLYPGAEGTYTLELSAEDSELDVYYELIFHNPVNIPSLIFFNTNSSYNTDVIKSTVLNDGDPNDLIPYSWYVLWPDFSQNYLRADYVGTYGIIPAGEKVNIPIFAYWPYEFNDGNGSGIADGSLVDFGITIKGQQYTGYSGSIPMNIFNLNTEAISYHSDNTNTIIPIGEICDLVIDQFGYYGPEEYACSGTLPSYMFEATSSNKGLIRLNR
ncbi:MAG: hypothetical protein IJB71_04925 [Bacilli bacterium]|nr:hypothetical protein [Bacilli bacterium]